MRSLPSDWWTGWVREIEGLGESGQRTGSAGDVHRVPFPMGVAGHGRFEVGLGRTGVVGEDKEHLKGGRDGWKKRKGIVQEVGLDLHGFGTKQTLAGLSPFLCLWVWTDSGGVMGEGVGIPRALNTLVPGLESHQGS